MYALFVVHSIYFFFMFNHRLFCTVTINQMLQDKTRHVLPLIKVIFGKRFNFRHFNSVAQSSILLCLKVNALPRETERKVYTTKKNDSGYRMSKTLRKYFQIANQIWLEEFLLRRCIVHQTLNIA